MLMIKTISAISLTAALFLVFSTPASALTASQVKQCQAMGASLQVRKQEAQAAMKARAGLYDQVEETGEQWEAAEAVRNFGTDKAAEADGLKTKYDRLKGELRRKDMALSSNVSMINADTAAYASMCDAG